MDLSAVIQQLRTYCPALAFVGGAADFVVGIETVVNPAGALPAGFVVPLAEDADDNEFQNGLRQEVRERCGIIVWFDNTADRRGQAASNQVDAMKYSIFLALLNWRIDPIRAQKGLQYAGSRYIDMDRARLFYQYDFELVTSITDEDGFPLVAVNLDDISVQINIDQMPLAPVVETPVEVDIHVVGAGDFAILVGAEGESAAGDISAISDTPVAEFELRGVFGESGAGDLTPGIS